MFSTEVSQHIVTGRDWTEQQAIKLCRELEAYLAPSIHVALTGSCLYKGESTKDADIILYPHNSSIPIVLGDLLEKLIIFGFYSEFIPVDRYDPTEASPNLDRKKIYVTNYHDKRVDIFLMEFSYTAENVLQ